MLTNEGHTFPPWTLVSVVYLSEARRIVQITMWIDSHNILLFPDLLSWHKAFLLCPDVVATEAIVGGKLSVAWILICRFLLFILLFFRCWLDRAQRIICLLIL